MNNELNRHLDGEISAAELSEAGRREATAWTRMTEAFRVEPSGAVAPAWLEQRVMAQIEALPKRGGLALALDWILSPRPLRVSPLAAGLVMAAFAWVLMMPTPAPDTIEGPTGASGATLAASGLSDDAVVYVQFVLDAPGAGSVSVAGDFSDWEPEYALTDADEDGVWTARVPVRPGVHGYMFLIDGTKWQTDPRADRYQEDGFGNRNAVLAVASS